MLAVSPTIDAGAVLPPTLPPKLFTAHVVLSNLKRGLEMAVRAVFSKSTLPVLTHVLVRAQGGRLRISGTDLEKALMVDVGAQHDEEWSVCVPAKEFLDKISKWPDDLVTPEFNPRTLCITLKVSEGARQVSIKCMHDGEFPVLPVAGGRVAWRQLPTAFLEALKRVAVAASTDEARPVLGTIHITVKDNLMQMEAGDGFRISRIALPFFGEPLQMLLPVSFLKHFPKWFDKKEPVFFSFGGHWTQGPDQAPTTHAAFQQDAVTASCQIADGQYPNVDAIIPRLFNLKLTFDRKSAIGIFKDALAVAKEVAMTTRIDYIPGSETDSAKMRVSASAAEAGVFVCQLDVTPESENDFVARPFALAVNARYMIEALDTQTGATTQMELKAPTAPIVFKDGDLLQVLMPMSLGK